MTFIKQRENSFKIPFVNKLLLTGSKIPSVIREERGQSLVEMALVLPFLVFLLMGILEVGRYTALSIEVSNAARAGAQFGAQNLATAEDSDGIQTAALNEGQNIPGITVSLPPTIICECAEEPTVTGCPQTCTPPDHEIVYVLVNAQGTFNPFFALPFLPTSLPVNGSSEMRVAQ
jgi:Flp pilus assembly protein TadG